MLSALAAFVDLYDPAFLSKQKYARSRILVSSVIFTWVRKGVSADADPHYQKLYGRVTDVCSNRRGQPSPSAMKEPRPGRIPSVIRIASPSGKYAQPNFPRTRPFQGPFKLTADVQRAFLTYNLCAACQQPLCVYVCASVIWYYALCLLRTTTLKKTDHF